MKKKNMVIIMALFLMTAYQSAAQISDAAYSISGDITTIYTLGNAEDSQKVNINGAGAYFSDPASGVIAKKNGFYIATNIYFSFSPFPWLEGYFKLYAIQRPGSFYLPLQLENNDVKDLTRDMTLDSVYGKANIFSALELKLPVDMYVMAGKFKSQSSYYGTVSKYKTEDILYNMNIKNDFTYELGIFMEAPLPITVSVATNYRLSEATQRYYEEDGGMGLHGSPVPDEFAPQIIAMIKLNNFKIIDSDTRNDKLSMELIYGNNVYNTYSGNAMGVSLGYNLGGIADGVSIPIGLSFGYYEKNIDLLAKAAVAPGAGDNTMSYRDSLSAGFGAGLRLSKDAFDLDFNLGGSFFSIQHYYRTDLPIIKLSVDTIFTWQKRFFIGGGFIAGSLSDVEWKTRDDTDSTRDDYNHTFTLAENMGYEVYGGINLPNQGKIIIGFNQNKGLSLNNMLEAKAEGQMKYKQLDTETADELVEAGGLYFKVIFKF
jgi:hypothetical protein